MIIAWSLFLIGVLVVVVNILYLATNYETIKKENEFENIRHNVWIYLIICICSAQYIWG